ncbi:hypothetical protein BGZ90_008683 [Linnemannia elongata]|nr:hypothetical protein BGZ90_008683 [Linnemannia elongata]
MSSDPVYLARTKSAGGERRAPPPIKPKPSTLTSPPTADASEVSSPTLTLHQQPSHVTLTANGTPTSSSFGDLRKTFERQQNSSPLFMASANAQGTRATPKGGVGLGASRGSTRYPSSQTQAGRWGQAYLPDHYFIIVNVAFLSNVYGLSLQQQQQYSIGAKICTGPPYVNSRLNSGVVAAFVQFFQTAPQTTTTHEDTFSCSQNTHPSKDAPTRGDTRVGKKSVYGQ